MGDLQAALGSLEPTYFLGTVVLTPSGDGRLTIIDGQQRLATTVLLFAAIRAELAEAGEESRASVLESQYIATRSLETNELETRLVLNIEDRDFFRQVILWIKDTLPTGGARVTPAYRRRIRSTSGRSQGRGSTSRSQVAGSSLFRWVSFVDSQVQVIVVVADTKQNSFLLFETLNDACGMDLTVVDLLKNHLFGLSGSDIEEVQRSWLASVDTLDSEEDQTLTTFLRHYWRLDQRGNARARALSLAQGLGPVHRAGSRLHPRSRAGGDPLRGPPERRPRLLVASWRRWTRPQPRLS